VVLESYQIKQVLRGRQHLLGLVKVSIIKDSWLGFLLNFDKDEKLETAINIPNMLFDMAGKATFSAGC
jgi:hypothetical protein